jgi:hypothetical protein
MIIRIEIDDLPVGKANPEAVLNKHVAFFFLAESGLSAGFAALGMAVGLDKRGFVVDELHSLREIDTGTRLASKLVECGQLGAIQAEEAASPIL